MKKWYQILWGSKEEDDLEERIASKVVNEINLEQKKDCETLLQKQKEEMKTIMSRYDLTMIDYERLENIEEEKQKVLKINFRINYTKS